MSMESHIYLIKYELASLAAKQNARASRYQLLILLSTKYSLMKGQFWSLYKYILHHQICVSLMVI